MTFRQTDYDILEEMRLEVQPVAIKYFVRKPENINHIDQKLTLCEMLAKAQHSDPFYSGPEDHVCGAGLYVLGQTDVEAQFISGEYGAGLGAFCDNRAASRLYHYIPKVEKHVINYVVFSSLDKLSFDPDVLLLLANNSQAEILLRAMSYKTGKMWESKYSSAIGCAWLFVYPYLRGEINFIPTGLGFGMKRRKLFPENRMFISIPFDQLPCILSSLKEMPWVPEPYKEGGPEYVKQLRLKLGLDDESNAGGNQLTIKPKDTERCPEND